mmetsp:Transcript_23039/g.52861  ORF Transcript_23039/g.52861 Transcript_23039/m.52861 type:complete len:397 (+) Transcript_23039:39-1229(+)
MAVVEAEATSSLQIRAGASKVNWRTSGRTLQRGTLISRTRAWRECPVDTSYVCREAKGFGSDVPRFKRSASVGSGAAALGPGSYAEKQGFHEEMRSRVSWGRRGTGTFASKSRRFGLRNSTPGFFPPRGPQPGPGAYDSDAALDAMQRQRSFSQAKQPGHQLALASAVPKSDAGPGPGEYERDGEVDLDRTPNTAGVTFWSRTERFTTSETSTTPGPAAYMSAGTKWAPASPTFSSSLADVHDPCFKEPPPRERIRAHPNLPVANRVSREALGEELAEQVSRERGRQEKPSPGPGQYKVRRPLTAGAYSPTPAFLPGGPRTEWISGDRLTEPGPGHYLEERSAPRPRPASACASFGSTNKDRGEKRPDVPGPAFYKPFKVEQRKCFHINTTGAFMA